MPPSREATVPITVTVDVPISAVSALRNATDNNERILAITTITSKSSSAVLQAIRAPQERSVNDLHLLGLPRELRDRIWELVLVKRKLLISVQPGRYRLPGILRTCKQTVAEAAPIYFAQNTFQCYAGECKGAWTGDWVDAALRMVATGDRPGADIQCTLYVHSTYLKYEWLQHLKEWLRTFHQGRGLRMPREPGPRAEQDHHFIRNAFNIVEELKGDDWQKVSGILDQYLDVVRRARE
ncbi:hypothetical protein LTR08_005154 [Meristemomyces frigidus]|nr:hypothetical protein LTR08_005154 [Meristemomyces frigidus]